MRFLLKSAIVTGAALFVGSANAETLLVTDVYRVEAQNFVFEDNFGSFRSDNETDETTPVPIEQVGLTFEVVYAAPFERTARFRNPFQSIDVLDFQFETADVEGVSEAKILTQAELQNVRTNAFQYAGHDDWTLEFRLNYTFSPAAVGDYHSIWIDLDQFTGFASGNLGPLSEFEVWFDSMVRLDNPIYVASRDGWTIERLSSNTAPAPSTVPIPASGALLLGVVMMGLVASRRSSRGQIA